MSFVTRTSRIPNIRPQHETVTVTDAGEGADDEEEDEDEEDDEEDEDGNGGGGGGGEAAQQAIQDQTQTNLVNLRRTLYLTLMSSFDFEEAGHKLLKVATAPGQEIEVVSFQSPCQEHCRVLEGVNHSWCLDRV